MMKLPPSFVRQRKLPPWGPRCCWPAAAWHGHSLGGRAGLWALGPGPWALGSGPWALGSEPWALGSKLWAGSKSFGTGHLACWMDGWLAVSCGAQGPSAEHAGAAAQRCPVRHIPSSRVSTTRRSAEVFGYAPLPFARSDRFPKNGSARSKRDTPQPTQKLTADHKKTIAGRILMGDS